MAHREGIRAFLNSVKVHGMVLDFGSGTKPIQKYLQPNDATFVTIDKLDHVGADFVADIEGDFLLPYRDVDFAFCLEVLEHTWRPDLVLEHIRFYLKEGGILYFSIPFFYEIHKEDDYHRFTRYGLERLFMEAEFKEVSIIRTGGSENEPWGYVGKAVK